ncbi:MAG: DUF1302 domain-containing protein [Deltaproteobacteria bacterium]|nr:DUF1302 domain-containing protein [Deltaproteobacteria bacterium]
MIRKYNILFVYLFVAIVLILVTPLIYSSPDIISYAQEFEEDFDEEEPDDIPEVDMDSIEKEEGKDSTDFYIGGFLKQEIEYGYDRTDRKLSKVKSILSLESSYNLTEDFKFKISGMGFYDSAYEIDGRGDYAREVLDDNESEVSLRELFFDWKIDDHFMLKFGRQVVAWGESDYSRVTDVINPRDLRGPGLTNLEDARLPTSAIRLTYESGSFATEFVTIHEHPGSSISSYGSDFDYYTSLRLPVVSIANEDNPENTFKNTGFAIKTTKLFNGGDISFYISKTFDDLPVLKATNIEFSGPNLSMLSLTPEYHTFKTYGVTGKKAIGSVLYKFELAFIDGKKIMRGDFINNITFGMTASELETFKSKDQLTTVLGIEYTGVSDLRVTLELENVHTFDFESSLATDRNDKRAYLQATYGLLNETMEIDLLCTYFERGKGGIIRLSTNYDIIDNLNIELGTIFYGADNSDSIFYNFRDQDRVYSRIKYSF